MFSISVAFVELCVCGFSIGSAAEQIGAIVDVVGEQYDLGFFDNVRTP